MPFSIVQVQGGQLALVDEGGNLLGVIDDSGVKKLATVARLHDGSTFYAGAKETGGNLATLAGKDFAVESGGNLASIKAKTDNIPTDPAKESGKLTTIDSTLTAIKSTDGIKKIADPLPAGTNNIGDVDLASAIPAGTNEIGKVAQGTKAAGSAAWPQVLYDASGNAVGVVLDGSLYRLQAQAKIINVAGSYINPATEDTLALIKSTDGIKKIVDALPVGDNRVGRVKITDDTNVLGVETGGLGKVSAYGIDRLGVLRRMDLLQDETDTSLYRLAISGKVSVTIPPPPPGGAKIAISADNPLSISQATSPYLTEWTIPTGKTLFIQQIIAGCQGDPSADGSKVEVYYYDGATEHLVDRIYILGQTQFGNYPDTSTARDGTVMTGSGTTRKLRIYRSRLSNSTQEIDAVVRGYTI